MSFEPLSSRILQIAVAVIMLGFTTTPGQAQTFRVVHSFTGEHDGGYPGNGFIADAAGNLYGTASAGGKFGNGVVYKINPKGAETVLHAFKDGTDGSGPDGFLIRDSAGNFYGTTSSGGAYGQGTVFELAGSKETVLYSFAGKSDGSDPESGLAMDAAGNLYGTTAAGGSVGNGTVFKLAPPSKQGLNWAESVLYSFGRSPDGTTPIGGVSLDSAGNIYGTTSANGTNGYGTVFQLTPGTVWTEHIIHNFQNANDGAVPYAGLIADQKGNFYGAATEGGGAGGGTIFELTSSKGNWTFNVIYSVPGWGISGSFRDVALDAAGNLYGTTHCDGDYNAGTVYELSPDGSSWNYTLLYTFTGGKDGLYSFSNIVPSQGKLYGTTKYGGAKGDGVIFEVTP